MYTDLIWIFDIITYLSTEFALKILIKVRVRVDNSLFQISNKLEEKYEIIWNLPSYPIEKMQIFIFWIRVPITIG